MKVGDLLLCVDNRNTLNCLVQGTTYTCLELCSDGLIAVDKTWREAGWYPWRFVVISPNQAIANVQTQADKQLETQT